MLSVVINLQTAVQKAILALSHNVQPSESAGHVFSVCHHHLIFVTCSCKWSTLAYVKQFPAELCSLDVNGCFDV